MSMHPNQPPTPIKLREQQPPRTHGFTRRTQRPETLILSQPHKKKSPITCYRPQPPNPYPKPASQWWAGPDSNRRSPRCERGVLTKLNHRPNSNKTTQENNKTLFPRPTDQERRLTPSALRPLRPQILTPALTALRRLRGIRSTTAPADRLVDEVATRKRQFKRIPQRHLFNTYTPKFPGAHHLLEPPYFTFSQRSQEKCCPLASSETQLDGSLGRNRLIRDAEKLIDLDRLQQDLVDPEVKGVNTLLE